jgi:hypothetical protein
MDFIRNVVRGLKTHVAVLCALMTCMATFIGLFPSAQGQAISLGLIAIAASLQRIATGTASQQIEQLTELLAKQKAAGETARPPIVAGRAYVDLKSLLVFSLICGGSLASAAEPVQTMALSPGVRAWYRNPDGSCVQCSLGMVGCHCNDMSAATLLWDTAYGPAVRGGSDPMRVESYCDQRGIRAWSVTGARVDDTIPWMEWAARTGRFAAIGAGTQHFQTLYGFDPNSRTWLVCNNNSTDRIDRYTDEQFRQLHAASGPWCVILQRPPSSVPPEIVPWWR